MRLSRKKAVQSWREDTARLEPQGCQHVQAGEEEEALKGHRGEAVRRLEKHERFILNVKGKECLQKEE